jgi:hypothetical protein
VAVGHRAFADLGHCRFSAASGLFQPHLAPSALSRSPVPGQVPGADNGRKMLMPFFIDAEEAGGPDRRPTRPSW